MIERIVNKLYRVLFYISNSKKYLKCGKNTVIKSPLLIIGKKNICLGERVTIRENARIEVINSNSSNLGKIIIDDNCCIEQGLHITAAKTVHIHRSVLISPYVYITDCMHKYDDITLPIMRQGLTIDETEIGENSWIGIGARIFAGVHIGKHCIIGANSVVTHDIPDYTIAVGCPARAIKQYNFTSGEWEKI